MTDHAGPRRCECHPGTKVWHPPVEVTQFWHPGSGLAPVSVFERQNKNKFTSMKQNSNLNHFQQLLFHTFPQNNLFWPYKNGRQNRSLGAKTGLLRRAGAKSQFPGDTSNVVGRRGLSYAGSIAVFYKTVQCSKPNISYVQKV